MGDRPVNARFQRYYRSRPVAALSITATVFGLVTVLRMMGALESVEIATYDEFLRRRPLPTAIAPRIALIEIVEDDIRSFGHPLCDDTLALVLERVLAAKPRAIGIDLYRDAPVPQPCGARDPDAPLPPHYQALGKVVTESQNVVMVMKVPGPDESGTPPPAFLEGTNQFGFSDLPIDSDGAVRRAMLFLWHGDASYVSFSLQLALHYLAPDGLTLTADPEQPEFVRLGDTTVPPFESNDGGYVDEDAAGYQFLIEYLEGANAYPIFSLGQVARGEVSADAFHDRVVILGSTAVSVKDHLHTPVNQGSTPMPGIEVHGHEVSQLIRFAHGESKPLAVVSERGEMLWVLSWAFLGTLIGLWNRGARIQGFVAIAALAGLVAFAYQLFLHGTWIPVIAPALVGASATGLASLYTGFNERAQRRQVTDLFSRFLRPAVADEIWRQREAFSDSTGLPRARSVTLTTLFSDLKGFTGASERMGPEQLTRWINGYLNAMAETVDRFEGVVDDYAGDGIKANFGFPVPAKNEDEITRDAQNAVRCALAMGEEMTRLNEQWRAAGLDEGRMRIGVYTGPATTGAIGGSKSLKYTTVGDSINTAARLETFDKESFASDPEARVSRVLIGGETFDRLDSSFETEFLGEHALSGKSEMTRIYRVLGSSKDEVSTHEGGER
jgi:adenylate cyclase